MNFSDLSSKILIWKEKLAAAEAKKNPTVQMEFEDETEAVASPHIEMKLCVQGGAQKTFFFQPRAHCKLP